MIERAIINHIGMAVPSIAEFLERNEALYSGFSRGPLIVNEVQKVREMFISDGNIVLELLEPSCETSPISGFLKRNRAGGLIHIALEVHDLESALRRVEDSGGKVILAPTPDIAFQGRRIAFVVLSGQVTELIEQAGGHEKGESSV
jgi:methylmalonyl-CoA/ethylmalonyl-CoA epimerase